MTKKSEMYLCEICGNKVQILEEGGARARGIDDSGGVLGHWRRIGLSFEVLVKLLIRARARHLVSEWSKTKLAYRTVNYE
jgi:desulfoferrodoxin-like iron-binding protein